jgi:hypothetical protein
MNKEAMKMALSAAVLDIDDILSALADIQSLAEMQKNTVAGIKKSIEVILGDRSDSDIEQPRDGVWYKGYNLSPLLDEIAEGEGTSDKTAKEKLLDSGYDVPFAYGVYHFPVKPLTKHTLDEIRAFQTAQITATKGKITGTKHGTSAVGRYQIMRRTLDGLRRRGAPPQIQLFDKEFQDRCAVELLKDCGLDNWLNGSLSNRGFHTKLANIWRSIQNPVDGYVEYDFEQPVGTTADELLAAFDAVRASRVA